MSKISNKSTKVTVFTVSKDQFEDDIQGCLDVYNKQSTSNQAKIAGVVLAKHHMDIQKQDLAIQKLQDEVKQLKLNAKNPIQSSKSKEECKFFNTEKGCINGNKCKFIHKPILAQPCAHKNRCKFFNTPKGCTNVKCHFEHY